MFGHATHLDNDHNQSQSAPTQSHQHQHQHQHHQLQQYEHHQQHHPQDQQPQFQHQYPRNIELHQSNQPYQYTLAHAQLSGGAGGYDYPSHPGTPIQFQSRPSSSSPSLHPVTLSSRDYDASHASSVASSTVQQQQQHEQQAGHPPRSSDSADSGSGSVSSGESAATTGPTQYSQQQQTQTQPPTTPSGVTSTDNGNNALQASPLFDVPPGYRTMLSSDKHATPQTSAHEQHEHGLSEVSVVGGGGSAPVRHNSMPSSLQSSLSQSGFLPSHQPSVQHSHLQSLHHHSPSSSSSVSSTPAAPSSYVHTALPYVTSGPSYDHTQPNPHMFLRQPHQSSMTSSPQSYNQAPAMSSSTQEESRSALYPQRHQNQAEGTASSSQAGMQEQQDAQFLAPAPPMSAPATTTTFALATPVPSASGNTRHVRGQSGMFKLETSEEAFGKLARNSVSGSSAGMSTNPSSAAHSRSTSVSSTSYSSFGPLSASASSSASSSFGDLSSSTSTPRRSMRLSNLDRKALCQYAEAHPRVKHEHIGSMFGVERSTVSKILKQRAKWFSVGEDNNVSNSPSSSYLEKRPREAKVPKNKLGRHPEMEARLMEWGQEQTRTAITLTDEQVRQKALEIAEQLKIDVSAFKASAGWLENFKDRAKYKHGKFDLTATVPLVSREPSEESMDGEAGETAESTPEDQSGQNMSSLLTDQSGTLQGSKENPSSLSYSPASTSGFMSPHGFRRQKRGGMSSLSSSSLSLPDLAEQEEQRNTDMEHSSSSVDLQSGRSSFSNLNMQQPYHGVRHQQRSSASYSADSSPFPSPTCSTGSELGPSGILPAVSNLSGTALQMSTPTQRTVYNTSYTPQSGEVQFSKSFGAGPPNSRLQQAGINFNLSLNSSPGLLPQSAQQLPTIPAGQPLDLMKLNSPIGQRPAGYDIVPFAQGSMLQHGAEADAHGNTIYSSRSRIHSAPGTSGYPHQIIQPLTPSGAGDFVPQPPYSVHSSSAGSPSFMGHYPNQHKSALHRSQTDPIPLYSSVGASQSFGTLVDDSGTAAGDTTVVQSQFGDADLHDSGSNMDIDNSLVPTYEVSTYPQDYPQQYVQNTQGPAHASMPRRATVSSAGDLSFSSSSGGGQSHAHGHSYSMSAVTTPVFSTFPPIMDGSEAGSGNGQTSLHEAYLSLRKVIGFLQHSTPSNPLHASLAAPSQLTTLEEVLLQLRQAHISQVPSLTPPRST